jgi:hypothetical protein
MKYDLVLQITRPNGVCTVNHFQVYDRFGQRSVVLAEQLADNCLDTGRPKELNANKLRHA